MKKNYSKYKAKKVTVDGIEFDSKKEAAHYQELKLLERAGKIKNLQLQVPFVLIPAQYEECIEYTQKNHKEKKVKKLVEKKLSYIADFVFEQDGKTIVEDVKGYRQSGAYSTYVIKRKLMLWIHGIRIQEV